MFLTHEDITVLLQLRAFAQEENNVGMPYSFTVVPTGVFKRLIDASGLLTEEAMEGKEPRNGPELYIRKKQEELIANYQAKNQGAKVTAIVRLQAEQSALIHYLQFLYDRGYLPR